MNYNYKLLGVSFTDANNGWAVGWGQISVNHPTFGLIFRTTNGGGPPPIPVAPLLISPANNAIGQALNLSLVWNPVAYANTYRVQLASDTSFTNIILDDSTLTNTLKTVTNLSPLTDYYWRVNAKNISGTGPFSSIWHFKTLGSPITPVLQSPPDSSIVSTTPLLDWNDVNSATSYRIQVSIVANFSTRVIDK